MLSPEHDDFYREVSGSVCVCVQYCMYVCMYVCYVMLLYWAAQLVCAVDGPCGDDVEAMYCTRVYSNTGLYIQHIVYQNRTEDCTHLLPLHLLMSHVKTCMSVNTIVKH